MQLNLKKKALIDFNKKEEEKKKYLLCIVVHKLKWPISNQTIFFLIGQSFAIWNF